MSKEAGEQDAIDVLTGAKSFNDQIDMKVKKEKRDQAKDQLKLLKSLDKGVQSAHRKAKEIK